MKNTRGIILLCALAFCTQSVSAQLLSERVQRFITQLKFKQAASLIEQEQSAAKQSGNKVLEADVLVARSMLHIAMRKNAPAIDDAEAALAIAKKQSNTQLQSLAHISLAYGHILKNDNDAVDHAEDAVELSAEQGTDAYSSALVALGKAHIMDKDLKKAYEAFSKAKQGAESKNNTSILALANIGIAKCMSAASQNPAPALVQTVLAMDTLAYSQALSVSDVATALEAALHHAELRGNSTSIRNLLNEALFSMGNTDDPHSCARILQEYGRVYMQDGRKDVAIPVLAKSLEFFQSAGDGTSMIPLLETLSRSSYERGDVADGLRYDEKLLFIFETNTKTEEAITQRNILASNYFKYGRFEDAVRMYQKSLEIARLNKNTSTVSEALKNLSMVYAKQGKSDLAFEYYKEFATASDETLNKQYIMKAEELRQQFEADKRSKEIELLSKDKIIRDAQLRRAAAESALKSGEIKLLNTEKLRQAVELDLRALELKRQREEEKFREEKRVKERAILDGELQRQRIMTYSFLGGVVLALGILGLLFNRYRLKKKSEAEIKAQNVVIQKERERSDQLLLNVLPQSIADRLKSGERDIADQYDNVTILFSDIVGFTKLSERIPPKKMVQLLNELFSRYDRLTVEYGVTRIKTVGDAYMIASGAPERCEDHAIRAARFAVAMQATVAEFAKEINEDLKIRIGLNSGDAVAAVVGEKKFTYDLWSDMVNTAARMESHGLPSMIQVTEEFKNEVERQMNGHGEFAFTSRGVIEVKGKGAMNVYFLNLN
ncbi:MAG: tetratricopeptide repeat protein [Candidatus Kapabacteria bacterium]|nr:tetratricopeptide repeat protein [Candidatus Kapabacteria bacterium]